MRRVWSAKACASAGIALGRSRAGIACALLVGMVLAEAPARSASAQTTGLYPAIPCERPDAPLADDSTLTCACDGVPAGECPYDSDHPCLHDPLLCRSEACEGLLDAGRQPVSLRCANVAVDRRDVPNVLLIFSDDSNWVSYQDVLNRTTGEHYSAWDQYFQNLVCHGGKNAGLPCRSRGLCGGGRDVSCESWTHRCAAGERSGKPCKQSADCGAGVACERCLPGECTSNPVRTPRLAELAAAGAFFPIAHAAASVCAPSLVSVLTGGYPKDFEPGGPPLTSENLARMLHDSHCSLSIGKTWRARWDQSSHCYDCCCEQAGCCDDLASCPPSCSPATCCGDAKSGFHYSIESDYRINLRRIGRRKDSLEKGACVLRGINQEGRAFLTWLLPYAPHVPSGAPEALKECYSRSARSNRVLVDGKRRPLAGPDYLGRISWFDCMMGSFLDFLETTPDTRFCPHPEGHTRAAHGCGPCTRECSDRDPCGDGVACVNGRCESEVPCLIDTTVILYFNDNGKALPRAKRKFFENGYRTPLVLSYGGLGSFAGSATASLPARVEPRVYADALAHSLDLVPTVLDYTRCQGGSCAEQCPAGCEGCGPCILGDCSAGPCARHRGRSLRDLVERGGAAPWRQYLFGHKATSNRAVSGRDSHYVRTSSIVAPEVPNTVGAGACRSDQDCVDRGWASQGPGLLLGLDHCVNGVCTKHCDRRDDCPVLGAVTSVDCVNGICATANACKLYHDPGQCSQRLYNLAHDPNEKTDLLRGSRRRREAADPLRVCFDETAGTPGRELFERLSCELVRWCLEGCDATGKIACPACCAEELCPECLPEDCAACLGAGTCVETDPGECWDCRRPCPGGDADCEDLGVACDIASGRCSRFCRAGLCSSQGGGDSLPGGGGGLSLAPE